VVGGWYMVTISRSALRFRTLGDIVTTLLHSCNDGTCYNLVKSRYHMVTITADFPPQRFSITASSTEVCWSLLHGPERCRCVVGGIWSPYRTPRSDSGHSVTSLLHCYIHVTMGHGYNLVTVTSRYHIVTITSCLEHVLSTHVAALPWHLCAWMS
jgi:hypothetical protein